MGFREVLQKISAGRTDLIIELLKRDNWQQILDTGPIKPLQWLVYYNDTTGLRAVIEAGGDLSTINLNTELGNAAFFGHWKVCDFLLEYGANANAKIDKTNETPLHNALAKAGRPYYRYVVQLLLEHGADPNARTISGEETGAFMRDVRTSGETPLHRAAAYADLPTIELLLAHGADRTLRDAHGDSPLSWASKHLRPGKVLHALSFAPHHISEAHTTKNISDHGTPWGNAMDWNLVGDYLPLTPRTNSSDK